MTYVPCYGKITAELVRMGVGRARPKTMKSLFFSEMQLLTS